MSVLSQLKGMASSALAKLPDSPKELPQLPSLNLSPLTTKAIIVAGSLLFVITVYLLVRSSPQKYYSKAARLHKKGEQLYLCGNHENAEASYLRAEEFRKRARELQ